MLTGRASVTSAVAVDPCFRAMRQPNSEHLGRPCPMAGLWSSTPMIHRWHGLHSSTKSMRPGAAIYLLSAGGATAWVCLRSYGIHTFDWAADCAARAKPAAMAANCAHPARIVLGPGGL